MIWMEPEGDAGAFEDWQMRVSPLASRGVQASVDLFVFVFEAVPVVRGWKCDVCPVGISSVRQRWQPVAIDCSRISNPGISRGGVG